MGNWTMGNWREETSMRTSTLVAWAVLAATTGAGLTMAEAAKAKRAAFGKLHVS